MSEILQPPQANRPWSQELRQRYKDAILKSSKISFARKNMLLMILEDGSDAMCHSYSRELTQAANS